MMVTGIDFQISSSESEPQTQKKTRMKTSDLWHGAFKAVLSGGHRLQHDVSWAELNRG